MRRRPSLIVCDEASLSLEQLANPLLSGPLYVEVGGGSKHSAWKKMLAVLHGRYLYYFDSASHHTEGIVGLEGCEVATLSDDMFSIITSVGKSVRCRAPATRDRDNWVSVIKRESSPIARVEYEAVCTDRDELALELRDLRQEASALRSRLSEHFIDTSDIPISEPRIDKRALNLVTELKKPYALKEGVECAAVSLEPSSIELEATITDPTVTHELGPIPSSSIVPSKLPSRKRGSVKVFAERLGLADTNTEEPDVDGLYPGKGGPGKDGSWFLGHPAPESAGLLDCKNRGDELRAPSSLSPPPPSPVGNSEGLLAKRLDFEVSPANSNIKWRVRYCLLEPGQGRFSVYSLYAQCLASDGTDAEAANVSEAERDFSELTVVPAAAINKGWHAPSSIVTGHERSDAVSAVAAIALGMGLVHPAYSVALDSGASMAVNAEASVDAVGRMLPDSPIAMLAPLNRYKSRHLLRSYGLGDVEVRMNPKRYHPWRFMLWQPSAGKILVQLEADNEASYRSWVGALRNAIDHSAAQLRWLRLVKARTTPSDEMNSSNGGGCVRAGSLGVGATAEAAVWFRPSDFRSLEQVLNNAAALAMFHRHVRMERSEENLLFLFGVRELRTLGDGVLSSPDNKVEISGLKTILASALSLWQRFVSPTALEPVNLSSGCVTAIGALLGLVPRSANTAGGRRGSGRQRGDESSRVDVSVRAELSPKLAREISDLPECSSLASSVSSAVSVPMGGVCLASTDDVVLLLSLFEDASREVEKILCYDVLPRFCDAMMASLSESELQ